jgi:hypothetical protein
MQNDKGDGTQRIRLLLRISWNQMMSNLKKGRIGKKF